MYYYDKATGFEKYNVTTPREETIKSHFQVIQKKLGRIV
jgi:hypothetical protein